MSGKGKSDPEGKILVNLSKKQFSPGEPVSGHLEISINNDISGDSIYLMLLGKIYTKSHRLHKNQKTEIWHETKVKENQEDFICTKHLLYSFKDRNESLQANSDKLIKKGSYKIFFSVPLPAELIYSTSSSKGAFGVSKDVSDHYDFFVKYTLEALIPTKKGNPPPIIGSIGIQVIGNDSFSQKRLSEKKEIETNITKNIGCLCLSFYCFSIRSEMKKVIFHSSEEVLTTLKVIHTEKSKQISKIKFEFKRVLVFASGYSCSKEISKGERIFKQDQVEEFSCSLPFALSPSHDSSIATLKYVIEYTFIADKKEIETFSHEFFVHSVKEIASNEKNEGDKKKHESEESDEEDKSKIQPIEQNLQILEQDKSAVIWQKCVSSAELYFQENLIKSSNSNLIPH